MMYGYDKTIHGTLHLDVEVYKGKVVSVWFRCMALPFEQHEIGEYRTAEMKKMSAVINSDYEIHAIDIKRLDVVYLLEKVKDCAAYWYFVNAGSFINEVQKAKRFASEKEAQYEKTRFGLDDTWHIVQHSFVDDKL